MRKSIKMSASMIVYHAVLITLIGMTSAASADGQVSDFCAAPWIVEDGLALPIYGGGPTLRSSMKTPAIIVSSWIQMANSAYLLNKALRVEYYQGDDSHFDYAIKSISLTKKRCSKETTKR